MADGPSVWAVCGDVTGEGVGDGGRRTLAIHSRGRPPGGGVRRVLEGVVEWRELAGSGPARRRSASPRTRRSWAAAGRGDRCRPCRARRDALDRRCRCCRGPQDAAERLLACPEVRAAAVVLESGEHLRPGEPGSSTSMATLPISRGPSLADRLAGRRGRRPGAGPRPARSCGRAAGSRRRPRTRRPALGGGVQGVALDRGQVLRAQRLVAVLAAAEVEEVVGVGVDRVADVGSRQLEADPAPLAAALEEQQVAAVGVDVHQVGVQRADAQAPSATEHHHRRADVVVGLVDVARLLGPQPRGAALGLERRRVEGGQLDRVAARSTSCRRARSSCGCARSRRGRRVDAHRDRAARRSASRRARRCRAAAACVPSASNGSSSSATAAASRPPGAQVRARGGEEGRAVGRRAAGSSASARG